MAKSAFNIFCHVFQNVFTYTNHSMKHPFSLQRALLCEQSNAGCMNAEIAIVAHSLCQLHSCTIYYGHWHWHWHRLTYNRIHAHIYKRYVKFSLPFCSLSSIITHWIAFVPIVMLIIKGNGQDSAIFSSHTSFSEQDFRFIKIVWNRTEESGTMNILFLINWYILHLYWASSQNVLKSQWFSFYFIFFFSHISNLLWIIKLIHTFILGVWMWRYGDACNGLVVGEFMNKTWWMQNKKREPKIISYNISIYSEIWSIVVSSQNLFTTEFIANRITCMHTVSQLPRKQTIHNVLNSSKH